MPIAIHAIKNTTRTKQGGEFIMYKEREMAARNNGLFLYCVPHSGIGTPDLPDCHCSRLRNTDIQVSKQEGPWRRA